MSKTRIFRTETRSRREVTTSRETENETRQEIIQFLKEPTFYNPGEREKEREREKEKRKKMRE
jgi:hypothetical protein